MLAASRGYEEILQIILSRGASINARNTHGNLAIHLAAERGHLGCVKLLMDKKGLANVGNFSYTTPLMKAAAYGHVDVVKYLLESGVNMAYQLNKSSESELTLAVKQVCHIFS